MIRAMFLRELTVMLRRPAFTAAVALHAGVLAWFMLTWREGMPHLAGANVYEQQHLVQWAVLAWLFPWAVARLVPIERGDALARLAARMGVAPSQIVTGRVLAIGVSLALIVLSAMPVALLAQQMSAIPLAVVVRDLAPVGGFLLLSAPVTLACVLLCRDRLAGWLAATASCVALLAFAHAAGLSGVAATAACAGAGFSATVALGARANASWRYEQEHPS